MNPLRPKRGIALTGLLTLLALTAPVAAASATTGGLTASAAALVAPAAAPAADAPAATSAARPALRSTAELAGAGTWRATPTTVVGHAVRISGSFKSSYAGDTVRIERQTPSGRWLRATTARVRSTGRFVARWRTRSTRYHLLRAVLAGPHAPRSSASPAAARTTTDAVPDADTVRVAVVGRATATWYGPGFYGKRTACGVVLRPDTIGVAHRRLPCGTQVEVRMGAKTIVAPVIDRGPFGGRASLDLTKNLADELGMDGVGSVRFVQRSDLGRVRTPERAPAL